MRTLHKPDIVDQLAFEGLVLRQKGTNFWGLCPLHDEKTASFKVDPERQLYYCFGCHEHGDVISFIQKYKGLSFPDALAYLEIGNSNGKRYRPDPVKIRTQALKQIYRQWENHYCLYLADILRWLDHAKTLCRDMADVVLFADAYHKESIWQHEFEILIGKDEEAKFQLFKEVWNGHKQR